MEHTHTASRGPRLAFPLTVAEFRGVLPESVEIIEHTVAAHGIVAVGRGAGGS